MFELEEPYNGMVYNIHNTQLQITIQVRSSPMKWQKMSLWNRSQIGRETTRQPRLLPGSHGTANTLWCIGTWCISHYITKGYPHAYFHDDRAKKGLHEATQPTRHQCIARLWRCTSDNFRTRCVMSRAEHWRLVCFFFLGVQSWHISYRWWGNWRNEWRTLSLRKLEDTCFWYCHEFTVEHVLGSSYRPGFGSVLCVRALVAFLHWLEHWQARQT